MRQRDNGRKRMMRESGWISQGVENVGKFKVDDGVLLELLSSTGSFCCKSGT